MSFLLSLMFSLFNKIGEEGRTGSAWKQGESGEEKRGQEARGRDGPKQCMHI
jgi:hypothetical protein